MWQLTQQLFTLSERFVDLSTEFDAQMYLHEQSADATFGQAERRTIRTVSASVETLPVLIAASVA